MSGREFEMYVILPAGGTGERMCMDCPKQYAQVGSSPLFMHTLHAFHRILCVKRILLCVSEGYHADVKSLISDAGLDRVTVVTAGSTRHRSIQCGVQALDRFGPTAHDVVVIHDVVRPFVTEDLVVSIARSAYAHGAAGVTRSLVSTVVRADGDGFLETSLDRGIYRASEMPQAFRYDLIARAYDECSDTDLDYGTECLQLILDYTDARVKLIPGPDYLWKVTHRRDLYALEACLKERDTSVVLVAPPPDLAKVLSDVFNKRNIRCVTASDDPASARDEHSHVICFHRRRGDLSRLPPSSRCTGVIIDVVITARESSSDLFDLTGHYAGLLRAAETQASRGDASSIVVLVQVNFNTQRLVTMLSDLVWNHCPSLHNQILHVD